MSNLRPNEVSDARFVIDPSKKPTRDHPGVHMNNLNLQEVTALVPDYPCQRGFVLHCQGVGLREIADTHRSYDPLQFVLLFPHGTDGWHADLKHVNGIKRLTSLDFYAYKLQVRETSQSYLHSAARLFQEYACVSYAKVENQRLTWILKNQPTIRADLYRNIVDAVNEHDHRGAQGDVAVGRRVVLPASHKGSPRNMQKCYQDALAVVARYHKPDLFVTITCNPQWEEILRELLPNQTAQDRPDLVARVFNLKKKAILKRILQDGYFGKVVAHFHVVEFQARGLPHAHLVVIFALEDRPMTTLDVDAIVCCELPPDPATFPEGSLQREQAQRLEDIVVGNMIHICGPKCLVNGVCKKGFPKPYSSRTIWNESDAYPKYKRRSPQDGGRSIDTGTRTITNADVVGYNIRLLIEFLCHINVEVVIFGLKSCKYLYKYCTKGPDRAMAGVQEGNGNEVIEYQDLRSIGSSEACMCLLGLQMNDRYPSVQALRVHLPDQQHVVFDDPRQVVEAPEIARHTELDAFFQCNAEMGNVGITYLHFPEHFTYDTREKRWKRRQRGTKTIGRLNTIHPLAGDVYYLRMLLKDDHCMNKTSFENLKTLNGVLHDTFKDVCRQLGLLFDDNEYRLALQEAADTMMCQQIRQLFVVILLFGNPANPRQLFDSRHHQWVDDFRVMYDLENAEILRAIALLDVETRLFQRSSALQNFQLPEVSQEMRQRVDEIRNHHNLQLDHQPALIAEETGYDREEMQQLVEERLDGNTSLNDSQRDSFNDIMHAVRGGEGGCFFIDALGGYGKTFLENTILAAVRTSDHCPNPVALAVASSGIAATLLKGGRTFHSRFKAKINTDENMQLSITAQSDLATLLRMTSLILWDEAPMAHRYLLEALDRCLRYITNVDAPFGRKVIVVLAGDFRQVLPIVKRGSRAAIVSASIKKSPLWPFFHQLRLTENLRALNNGNDLRFREFADWLLQLGNGTVPSVDEEIELPADMCLQADIHVVSDWVFPDLRTHYDDRDWMSERAILAPTNSFVDEINMKLSTNFPGNITIWKSADETVNIQDAVHVPVEYLNSINAPGLPPHALHLKPKMPLILLWNISPTEGLCNGTRLVLEGVLGGNLLQATIANGEHAGKLVFIPRISMEPSDVDLPFKWKRRQFPVRVAFAMTINKAQGQTLKHVGVWLKDPVFSHGQLYVAASRVGDPSHIKFAVDPDPHGRFITRNVVYPEVFSR